MRVLTGKPIRVGPGDEVVVRAQLTTATLGRLYVFAREDSEDRFSPYVPHVAALAVGDEPSMLQPMSMRLVAERPMRQISFVADIDGFVCVMQEVDTATDPLAKVRLKRKICPDLDWKSRILRKFQGIFSWPIPKLS
ncbi:hypothetical protein [Bradyrhizobium neotropicale]|uniref:hypothetical protein n=1 Tax=Bradyrhizobium neotropicale TaxID=1497615 RepID=UPI001AD76E26|nr:hypothetical protein [Bradyrhizobium neotropicale]MBO4228441.1 hypothetical protein [Bradyrhizobium neotropicale]